ncbi:NAD(P)-dependent oxidoreductase [Phanerochaete sordida]|uniref:NAD(P)-dependent oxidoreductase n=1 Tax=Phanerochaete sordida TaxID=48140 RepID=A0A9P3G8S0_9APHY|nr:NAD(P)-dependent oxidoreductase [Phanerochaete sordida]
MTPLQGGRSTPSLEQIPFSRPHSPHKELVLGFAGLGAMGYPMARNLATRLQSPVIAHPIYVWNRSRAKCESLQEEVGKTHIKIADKPEDLALNCDIVITNLANDEVVKGVFEKFVAALKEAQSTKNKIFVETSTVYPTLAGELDTLMSSVPHCHLVMAPVFGAPPVADAAQLIVVMAGDYRSKKEVAHLMIPAMGRKVIDLGGNLEKAPTFKLIGNSMILGSLEILAESFTLAEKSGIKPTQIHGLVKDLMPAPILDAYANKMVHDLFDGSKGFAIDGGIKDSTHIRKLAAEVNSPMPALDTAHQHLLTARALHDSKKLRGDPVYETLDWSSIVAGTRVASGLDGFDSKKHSTAGPVPE